MKTMRRVMCGLLVGVGLFMLWGCNSSSQQSETDDVQKTDAVRVTPVKTVAAHVGRMVNTITTTGTVFAIREARISPKVSGRIAAILVKEGDLVDANQELVRLEQQDFLLAQHRADAALGIAKAALQQLLAGARKEDIQQAQAALSQAQAALEEAQSEYERAQSLYDDKVASQQMFDAAKARYTIAEQSVRMAAENLKKAQAGPTAQDIQLAKARIREAEVGLEIAEQQLQDSALLSPFAGIVADKAVNEGEMVSPLSPLTILHIVAIDTVKIECAIPEREMSRVQIGSEATIEADAYPGERFPGQISVISPVVNPASRTFTATIEIPNADHRLKPGMFARVQIVTDVHENVIVIPRAALTFADGKDVVFVAREATAAVRQVTPGLRDDQFVEIVQGLQAGENVIIEGNYGLTDGAKVSVYKPIQ